MGLFNFPGCIGLSRDDREAEAECNGSFTAAALLWASKRQRSTVRKRDGEREKEKEEKSRPLSCDSCSVKHTSLNDIMLLSVCHAIVSTKKLYKTSAKLRGRGKQVLANHSSLSHFLSPLLTDLVFLCAITRIPCDICCVKITHWPVA